LRECQWAFGLGLVFGLGHALDLDLADLGALVLEVL
jgi:hypothetical protein